MDLLFKSPLISIYWLDDIHTGYGVWTGLPRPDTAKEGLDKCEEILLTLRTHKWISNTEDALVSSAETQEIIARWLERMGRTRRLHVWADIPPKSATARLVVKNLGVESTLHSILFAQFPTLEDAKAWIRTK